MCVCVVGREREGVSERGGRRRWWRGVGGVRSEVESGSSALPS